MGVPHRHLKQILHSGLPGLMLSTPPVQVFVSMVTVALLALVALTSYHIVTRQKAIERCAPAMTAAAMQPAISG